MTKCNHFSIYLIIRWKKTKNYIIPFSISILISFLLYVPYIIYEAKNGFPNLSNIISLKNSAKSAIQHPQIWTILFFPTNEPNHNYGNQIITIFLRWFNGDIKLIFSFLFYIISVIIGAASFIILLKDLFTKQIKDKLLFKESALIYFIYVIATIVIFIILNLGAGRPRYFYNIYPLTFIPIIYLLKKVENKKIFYFLVAFSVVNLFAIYIQIDNEFKNRKPAGWNFMVSHIENIIQDAATNSFDLYDTDNYSYPLIKIENPNFKLDTNSNIKYNIVPVSDKNFNSMKIIYSNEQYITYKEVKSNTY